MTQLGRINAVAMERANGPVKWTGIRAAMAKCMKAYTDRCGRAKGNAHTRAEKTLTVSQAIVMYRLALPALDSFEDIHAFIACVAQGVAIGVFNGRDGSQLLYAAQVALSVVQTMKKEEEEQCKGKNRAA